MMKNNNNPHEIDPGLLEKINLLEETPERDPRLAARTREKFLTELENMPVPASRSFSGWVLGIFGFNHQGRRKFAFSTLAAALLVVLILFGGASATAYAAQSALPGDALYSVKTSLEQTQITLANDAYNQAQLHLRFAQRRLDEIKQLLAQGRTNDIEFASTEFEHYIQQAMHASQLVQTADPERGAELSKLVSQALLDYAGALKSVLVTVPDPVKPAVQNALMASQDGAGDEIEITGIVASISDTEIEIEGVVYSITDLTEFDDSVQIGDLVKIHVIKTEFGAMVISEIELAGLGDEDNANFSGNDNSNESFSGNENENESGDDDNDNGSVSNENMNENDSDDDLNENESSSNANDSDDDSNKNESNENESKEDDSGSGSSNSGNSNDDDSHDDDHNDNDSDEDDDNSNGSNRNDNDSSDEEDNSNNGG